MYVRKHSVQSTQADSNRHIKLFSLAFAVTFPQPLEFTWTHLGFACPFASISKVHKFVAALHKFLCHQIFFFFFVFRAHDFYFLFYFISILPLAGWVIVIGNFFVIYFIFADNFQDFSLKIYVHMLLCFVIRYWKLCLYLQ